MLARKKENYYAITPDRVTKEMISGMHDKKMTINLENDQNRE